jgi:serine/threonine-protein kinase
VKLGLRAQRRHDVRAYNDYLRGRYYLNKRTPEALRKSLECFDAGLAIDPQFALGHAGLADAYILLADYGVLPPAEAMSKARQAALRALELDATLGEAEASLGFIRALYDWQWEEGSAHFRRAIALNPGYASALHWYGLDCLALRGRFAEAAEMVAKALALDPLSALITEGVGYIHLLQRDYEKAIEAYGRVLEMDSFFYKGYAALGRAHSLAGRYGAAIENLERAWRLCPEVPTILGALAQTYGLAGRVEEAGRTIEALSDLARRRHVQATCFALAHLGLGQEDCALEWLEKAVTGREISVTSIGVHPAYDVLRQDARFRRLVEAVGLADVA